MHGPPAERTALLPSLGGAGAEGWRAGQGELYAQGRSVGGFSVLALAQSAPDALRALTERALRTVCDCEDDCVPHGTVA
ncbi:hypothetical protein ACIQCF_33000 [Streptomyces sp. NPDC088353]|uniref:hypothetical protein n=1 Tax=unclassified Streptomyces TaxID=2593676 RepID=UPI00367E9A39